jgi:hypothetical protein
MIDASGVVSTIVDAPWPVNEGQARELAGLKPHQAALVMRVAHENTGGRITATAIRDARRQPWTDAEIRTAVDGYRIHPGISCFPAFRPIEWEPFAESVGNLGLIEQIALSPDGTTIVDGRFRYLALRWNGIDPATATTIFGSSALKRLGAYYTDRMFLDYIYSANMVRAHYTDDQVAMFRAQIEDIEAAAR